MWTVGIETSCGEGSIALLGDDDQVVERSLSREGRRHAQTLVFELQRLLADAGLAAQDCEPIAVSRGPGSFTGLRVGVVCAKTWAFATGCRVVGIDTLEAVAARAPREARELDVIADAQRGDLYLGQYRRADDDRWIPQAATRIVSIEAWRQTLTSDRIVAGPAVRKLKQDLAGTAVLLPEELWLPRAADIARLGRCRAQTDATDDFWSLEPLYLRKSAAEEKAEA